MVQLNEELLALLDAEARRLGVSRSAVIRSTLEEHFAELREARVGRAIAEGYRRIPPAEPDTWADLALLGDQGTGAVLQRLDQEEREQGLEPW